MGRIFIGLRESSKRRAEWEGRREKEMQRSAEEERGMAIPFAGVGCLFLRLTLRFDKDILYCPHREICLGLVNTPGAPYALGRPSG